MNLCVFAFIALFAIVSSASPKHVGALDLLNRQTTQENPLCLGFCYTSIAGKRQAERNCKGKDACAVRSCTTEVFSSERKGFSCVPIPPAPITEGAISIPSTIQFPPDVIVGGTVTVKVNVTVDEVSSASREDFYLLTDATGSMRNQIMQTKKDFQKLIDSRSEASGNVAFGVGYYRDEEDIPPFENLQAITEKFSLAIAAVNKLEGKLGGDFEEANLYALSQVATSKSIGWREGTRKILVYFGDAPGHEPTCPDSGRITRETVIDQLNEKGIAVIATNFGTINSGLNSPTTSAEGKNFGCKLNENTKGKQATDITNGTKGALKLASDPVELVDIIVDAVESLDQELSVVTTDCDGKVEITFNPNLPLSIAAGETKRIVETAKILPGACDFPDGFDCTIDLVLSGVGVKQVISTTSIAGCVKDTGGGLFPF